jgi:anti-sigma factor RsiW
MTQHQHAPVGAPRHPSTLTLHRLRYGELSGPALEDVHRHLGACEACAARLRHQERERAAFVLQPMPPAVRALADEQRQTAAPSLWRRFARELAPFALAAAAALLVFVAIPSADLATDPAAPGRGVATRGALPAVEAWVDAGTGLRPLRDGEALGEGARVQLAYDPGGASYVALAGRDGTGRVEVYATDAPTGVGLVRAPFALTLDDAPGVQELFVVGGDRPLDERTVKAAVSTGVPGVRVARLAIRKE